MLEDQNFVGQNSSIEGLEQQLLAVVDSPSRQNAGLQGVSSKFPFDSRSDSLNGGLGIDSNSLGDEDSEAKMYDVIISKVLSNPRIDKKTLLRKFISKIEMESNIGGGLSDELSHIKKMIDNQGIKESSIETVTAFNGPPDTINSNNVPQHAVSQEDKMNQMLDHSNAQTGA